MLTTFPTKQQFREWLQQKPPEEVIAHDWNCYTCPIASFMGPGYGIDPADDQGAVWWYSTNDKQPLPAWAEHFTNCVDYENDTDGCVTAAQCLHILDEVTDAY